MTARTVAKMLQGIAVLCLVLVIYKLKIDGLDQTITFDPSTGESSTSTEWSYVPIVVVIAAVAGAAGFLLQRAEANRPTLP